MKKAVFILQRHDAYKAGLHYDLRIQYPYKNKLTCFIFRGLVPSPANNVKDIFVIESNVHDVDLLKQDYLEIPKGEYGGGILETIQKGYVEIIEWNDGKYLKLNFISEKKKDKKNYLEGTYMFIHLFKDRKSGNIWKVVRKKKEDSRKVLKNTELNEQFEGMSLIQALAFRTALTNLSQGMPFSTVVMKLHEQTKLPITYIAKLLAQEAIRRGIIVPGNSQ